MYRVFVTVSGCGEDECYDYPLGASLWEGLFDTFEEALRSYHAIHVVPFGAIAMAIHARHPEMVQIEAEYDIYEDDEPDESCEWYVNEAIWWGD